MSAEQREPTSDERELVGEEVLRLVAGYGSCERACVECQCNHPSLENLIATLERNCERTRSALTIAIAQAIRQAGGAE